MEQDLILVIRLRVRTNDSLIEAGKAVADALTATGAKEGAPITEYLRDGDPEWKWVSLENAELVSSREATA